jgi:hypothetical protein
MSAVVNTRNREIERAITETLLNIGVSVSSQERSRKKAYKA